MLLPSKELRKLSQRVDICLSGKTSPQGCDIRFRQFYWLMVYDARGELMSAYNLSNELTKLKKRGMTLPDALVSIVDRGLKTKQSLEELERRYVTERGSESTYDGLRERIDAMAGVAQMRVAAFLRKAAPKTDDPGLSRARGIQVETAACNKQVINHGAYASLRKSIEGFILEYPNHPSCRDLIEPLANTGLKYAFDLSSKCEDYAREWTARARGSAKARESLTNLAKQLLVFRNAEIARTRKRLSKMGPKAYGASRLRARLGEAKETLAGLDSKRSFGVMKPIHAEWRQEASAKLLDD